MRLAIVENDRCHLDHLKHLLEGVEGFEVVATCSSGKETLARLRESSPEVILTELNLIGTSGMDLIKTIKATIPPVQIIAYTASDDRNTILSAIKAGACGYILKECSPRELIEALHLVWVEGAYLSPKNVRTLIQELQDANNAEQYLLSCREKEILTGMGKGLSYKEIGKRLHISPHTVHTHVKKIHDKLGAKNRKEALAKARKKGIL